MEFLLDVEDEKALFLLELLTNFEFVKAKVLIPDDSGFLEQIKEMLGKDDLNEAGRTELLTTQEWLKELTTQIS